MRKFEPIAMLAQIFDQKFVYFKKKYSNFATNFKNNIDTMAETKEKQMRFAVDIWAQRKGPMSPPIPINTFVFFVNDGDTLNIRDIYDKVLEFIKEKNSHYYNDLKVVGCENGFLISSWVYEKNLFGKMQKAYKYFYINNLRRL